MYPTWVYTLNLLSGLLGCSLGIMLIHEKIKIKKAIILNICIVFLAYLISIYQV